MKNKKGQVINLITGTIVGLLVMALVVVAVLFGISAINPASFFGTATAAQNATNSFTYNITAGTVEVANKFPTVMLILAGVLALAGIVILIGYVRNLQSTAGGTGNTL
jgi:hypothetical protein